MLVLSGIIYLAHIKLYLLLASQINTQGFQLNNEKVNKLSDGHLVSKCILRVCTDKCMSKVV